MKLTARDNQAIEILKQGGYFRKALERDRYTKREQFQVRLRDAADHRVVTGIGFATWTKLAELGFLMKKFCEPSSVYPTESKIHVGVKFADVLSGEM